MRIRSLRRFLSWTIIAAVVLIGTATAVWNYLDFTNEVQELFDAELAQSARILDGMIDGEILDEHTASISRALAERPIKFNNEDDGRVAFPLGHVYERKISFQIRTLDGRIVLSTPSAPESELAPLEPGFNRVRHEDYAWSTFTLLESGGQHWLQLGQRDDIRGELANDVAVEFLVQILVTLPIVALFVWLIVWTAMKPLRRVALDLQRRSPSDLQPIDTTSAPEEIGDLISALNQLFARLTGAFQSERRFTADAAHELRTPLAALIVHAQNAANTGDPGKVAHSLQQVKEGARRLHHLVEQLLTLSRLDPEVGLEQWDPVDLRAVCLARLSELAPMAEQRQVSVENHLTTDAAITRGSDTVLGMMVRNILDNAIRYTPGGGKVTLSLIRKSDRIVLTIQDNGPGIANHLKERVPERFYRPPGQREQGSGLGLSIVCRIAEIYGASVSLEDPREGTGLIVRIHFVSAE